MSAVFSLEGKVGLIAGMANQHSIAYGCARACHLAGAELFLSFGHAKTETYIAPLGPELGDPPMLRCDVQDDAQLAGLFAAVEERWGRLDFLIHSIAFAPREALHGRVTDCSREGFAQAMDISCHSFIRMARLAEPLMADGGCLLTMSYLGAERVVANYGVMGPVKAALESAVRYVATELGPRGIRVHALSPGPIPTRAASGIADFDALLAQARDQAPLGRLADIDDVGQVAAFLVSDAARGLTGSLLYVDSGLNIRG